LYNIDVESIEEFKGTEKELTQYITLWNNNFKCL
jgi:hypothetical protein